MTFPSRHIHISINLASERVYAFVSNPENLPKWAAGLSGAITKIGNDWMADSPMGKVKVEFVAKNELGVLDHLVTLPNNTQVNNHLRVFPNGDGSELIFTLYRLDGITEKQFEADGAFVEKDLVTLKSLLEN